MLKRDVRALGALFLVLVGLGAQPSIAAAPGDPLGLEAFKGRVVYVDFWASWCEPCRLSFPWMNDLQRDFANQGLVVIAVNVDHERADAEQFLRKHPPEFKIAYDPDGVVAEHFHVKGMPTSFLIDRAGKVQLQHAGFRPQDRVVLEQRIRSLLAVQ